MRWPWAKDPDVQASLDTANEALADVQRLEPQVHKVTADLRRHLTENHIAQKVLRAMGGR